MDKHSYPDLLECLGKVPSGQRIKHWDLCITNPSEQARHFKPEVRLQEEHPTGQSSHIPDVVFAYVPVGHCLADMHWCMWRNLPSGQLMHLVGSTGSQCLHDDWQWAHVPFDDSPNWPVKWKKKTGYVNCPHQLINHTTMIPFLPWLSQSYSSSLHLVKRKFYQTVGLACQFAWSAICDGIATATPSLLETSSSVVT